MMKKTTEDNVKKNVTEIDETSKTSKTSKKVSGKKNADDKGEKNGNEANKPAKKLSETEVIKNEMSKYREEVAAYIVQWNDKSKFNEYAAMRDIETKIADALDKYNADSETLCFNSLKKEENVMLAAAKQLTFPVISVHEKKDKSGKLTLEMSDKNKRIDPLRLHNKVDGGIGYNKDWRYMIEHLNFRMTCSRALQLGIDPTSINGSYAMKDESAKISSFKTVIELTDEQKAILGTNKVVAFDYNAANATLMEDIQVIIDAMLGEGYKANQYMVAYLNSVYAKRDNKSSLTVGCANHKYMRSYLMDICNAAVTGNSFKLSYKEKK